MLCLSGITSLHKGRGRGVRGRGRAIGATLTAYNMEYSASGSDSENSSKVTSSKGQFTDAEESSVDPDSYTQNSLDRNSFSSQCKEMDTNSYSDESKSTFFKEQNSEFISAKEEDYIRDDQTNFNDSGISDQHFKACSTPVGKVDKTSDLEPSDGDSESRNMPRTSLEDVYSDGHLESRSVEMKALSLDIDTAAHRQAKCADPNGTASSDDIMNLLSPNHEFTLDWAAAMETPDTSSSDTAPNWSLNDSY